ncbi:hypothetical protein EVAR_9612_1 [Eumeta japonica]|uniref:Uncharacterized protein n=1 Tax=Eumeta variegata TaxID=151549 RepID=A0A4C1TMM3_EUMVA|nr:hypothetical protein EVAR_9612_1 [Eumeta japonica]
MHGRKLHRSFPDVAVRLNSDWVVQDYEILQILMRDEDYGPGLIHQSYELQSYFDRLVEFARAWYRLCGKLEEWSRNAMPVIRQLCYCRVRASQTVLWKEARACVACA